MKANKKKQQLSPEEALVKEAAPIEKIEIYLKGKYEFRLNVVTGYPEYRLLGNGKYMQVTSSVLNTLWRELLMARRTCTPNYLKDLLTSDFATTYDPFKEYLDSLPKWDEETDYIKQLSETVRTSDPEFFLYCLRKWFIAMVGCWIEPEVINQTVIVFSGAQGIGKTTWVDSLVPPLLKSYYYSGTINPSDKDTLIHLSECALINLDELENLNKSEIGALKEVITKGQIRLRRPYSKSSEVLPRRASFAGSVNHTQFLNDPTGSRRFLCFEAYEFKLNAEVEMDMVFSQAKALLIAGFQYWFDKDEIRQLERNNEQFQKISLEEEMLLKLYEPCGATQTECEFLAAAEIASVAGNEFKIRVDIGLINNIGKAATRNGFSKVKKQGVSKYCLKRRRTDTTSDGLFAETQEGGEVTGS